MNLLQLGCSEVDQRLPRSLRAVMSQGWRRGVTGPVSVQLPAPAKHSEPQKWHSPVPLCTCETQPGVGGRRARGTHARSRASATLGDKRDASPHCVECWSPRTFFPAGTTTTSAVRVCVRSRRRIVCHAVPMEAAGLLSATMNGSLAALYPPGRRRSAVGPQSHRPELSLSCPSLLIQS